MFSRLFNSLDRTVELTKTDDRSPLLVTEDELIYQKHYSEIEEHWNEIYCIPWKQTLSPLQCTLFLVLFVILVVSWLSMTIEFIRNEYLWIYALIISSHLVPLAYSMSYWVRCRTGYRWFFCCYCAKQQRDAADLDSHHRSIEEHWKVLYWYPWNPGSSILVYAFVHSIWLLMTVVILLFIPRHLSTLDPKDPDAYKGPLAWGAIILTFWIGLMIILSTRRRGRGHRRCCT